MHVTADVVAPPAIADVGRRGGKVRLEGEAFPVDEAIARKAYGIAMAAGATVAGKGQRRVAPAGRVQVAGVVQHEQRVYARHAAAALLLPVDPPEVHALALEIVQHHRLKGFPVLRAPRVVGQRLAAFRLDAHRPRHGRVQVLKGPQPVGWMVVQCDLQSSVVQPFQKPGRIRKQLFIPRVPRPARAVLRVDIGDVPVHVQHRHGQRHVLGGEALHQGHVGPLAVPESGL